MGSSNKHSAIQQINNSARYRIARVLWSQSEPDTDQYHFGQNMIPKIEYKEKYIIRTAVGITGIVFMDCWFCWILAESAEICWIQQISAKSWFRRFWDSRAIFFNSKWLGLVPGHHWIARTSWIGLVTTSDSWIPQLGIALLKLVGSSLFMTSWSGIPPNFWLRLQKLGGIIWSAVTLRVFGVRQTFWYLGISTARDLFKNHVFRFKNNIQVPYPLSGTEKLFWCRFSLGIFEKNNIKKVSQFRMMGMVPIHYLWI